MKIFLTGYEQNASWDYILHGTDFDKKEMISFLNFIKSEIESGAYIKKILVD